MDRMAPTFLFIAALLCMSCSESSAAPDGGMDGSIEPDSGEPTLTCNGHEGLGEIEGFLADNPNEVVSIIFENYITHAQTASTFESSGLIDYVYAHEAGEPWPTLGALIDAGTRLLVFQEKLPEEAEYPWLMRIWDHAWETPFSAATPEDLSCDVGRGNPENPLFLLNHFLTGLGGDPALAEMVNYNPFFIDRARECEDMDSALPNFVAVDFYDIGDLFEVVDALNGV